MESDSGILQTPTLSTSNDARNTPTTPPKWQILPWGSALVGTGRGTLKSDDMHEIVYETDLSRMFRQLVRHFLCFAVTRSSRLSCLL